MNVHPSYQKSRYIHVLRDEPLMKANDKAWSPDVRTALEYYARMHLNSFEFVLDFSNDGRINNVFAIALREIKAGEEIGITYGYGYWDTDV